MIYNYLKIAIRNLLKYKFISFINLFGLTVGIACCLLILTYIINELSYDKFHPETDRTYRVTRSFRSPETGIVSLQLGSVAPPFAPLLINDFKEIQKITRLLPGGSATIRYEDKMFNEDNTFWGDEHFFDFFKVQVVKGNPAKALSEPYSIMLTEEIAKKYFGNEEPLNKMVRLDNEFNFKVTGVYKDLPANTHLHPKILLSFNTLKDTAIYGEERLRTNFGNNSFLTYIRVPEGYDTRNMEKQFPAFLDRHLNPGERIKASQWTALGLQKITDIHLHSHLDDEVEENGDIKRVYIFSAIALFILLIAGINYMNLSTARSALRAREIGVRKVVGAQRKEIIAQFLSESVLVAWLAMLLAVLVTWLSLPGLNKLSGQQLNLGILFRWEIIVPMLIVPFAVGILSGIYPALFMSSFKPILVLKGLFKVGGSAISFRQVLVTTQFAISIILIISTITVFKQMRYMQQKDLGFDKNHIVNLPYSSALNNQYDAFRLELLSNTHVKNAGRSSRIPTGRLLDANGARIKRSDTLEPAGADIKFVSADQDFIPTYGTKIVAGRAFSREFSTDTASFIINEAAVKALGLKSNDDAIGKDFGYGSRTGKLIGVLGDFHFESLHQKIVPLVLLAPRTQNGYRSISIKIAGSNIPSALSHIQKTWQKFLPETPYQYTFLDERFARLYQSEERQKSIFTVFACIAIFIACLGLFGLSAFAISQRVKEIGIRKVLGANVSTIVALLSKDFLKLVLLAAVIAFPVAWFAMDSWLQDFAYRINISWWVFVLAGIIAAIIAFVTISFQAVKAAIANPVKSLRSE
jgi:putative ABC transport system permease protein